MFWVDCLLPCFVCCCLFYGVFGLFYWCSDFGSLLVWCVYVCALLGLGLLIVPGLSGFGLGCLC